MPLTCVCPRGCSHPTLLHMTLTPNSFFPKAILASSENILDQIFSEIGWISPDFLLLKPYKAIFPTSQGRIFLESPVSFKLVYANGILVTFLPWNILCLHVSILVCVCMCLCLWQKSLSKALKWMKCLTLIFHLIITTKDNLSHLRYSRKRRFRQDKGE